PSAARAPVASYVRRTGRFRRADGGRRRVPPTDATMTRSKYPLPGKSGHARIDPSSLVLADFELEPSPLSITYPSAQLLSARTRAFIDTLRTELAAATLNAPAGASSSRAAPPAAAPAAAAVRSAAARRRVGGRRPPGDPR